MSSIVDEIVRATGLPEESTAERLSRLIKSSGQTPADISLEQLRDILAQFVQDVLVEVKDEVDSKSGR